MAGMLLGMKDLASALTGVVERGLASSPARLSGSLSKKEKFVWGQLKKKIIESSTKKYEWTALEKDTDPKFYQQI